MENASFVFFADSNGDAGGAPAGTNTNSATNTAAGGTTISSSEQQQTQRQQTQGGGADGLVMWIPFIILIVVMFAISIRTSSKEKKKREEMMNSIRKGTKVMTSGGIFGEIAEVQKDAFLLKIANNVQIAISRTAIAQVVHSASADDGSAADDTKTEVKKK